MRILLTGGCGYIGQRFIERLKNRPSTDRLEIVVVDRHDPPESLRTSVEFRKWDVRETISAPRFSKPFDLICNFAAVHREPGHAYSEYFDTNLAGARNICEIARQTDCLRVIFTSSIAVYGPTTQPTDEACPTRPTTAYGISKLVAEHIHREWATEDPSRQLIICRPGVVYGPGDPGNILRMIRAIQKGFFFFPGNPRIAKSYAYIEGLLDSFEFAQEQKDRIFTYNYVEHPTEPLNQLIRTIESTLGIQSRTFALPLGLLILVARVIQFLSRGRSPIHPDRVRKAATPTHIVPGQLIAREFPFNYDFAASLIHWKSIAPNDFESV